MAESAPATQNNEARRKQMLHAAAELICERGFSDTRISDVAKRAGVSSALVIYYFGTRDRLLVDALRYSEESFYDAAERMLSEVSSLRERLSLLIKWTCVRDSADSIPGAWGLWFDLWAQAFRHEEVAPARVELDGRWRKMIVDTVESADLPTGFDVRGFALTFSALLDGLSIQVALEDPEVDSDVAYEIAMRFAERELDLEPQKSIRRPHTTTRARSARKKAPATSKN